MNTASLGLILAGMFVINHASATIPATLIQEDSRFGPGTLTLDTSTGLQWLDLTLTVGLDYYSMEAQFAPGGAFAGFRHASTAEVESLWASAGIPYIGVGMSTAQQQANYGPITALESLIGITGNGFTTGMTSDVNSPGMSQRPILYTTGPGLAQASVSEWASGASSQNIGNWLVPIPEPSSMVLLTTAALAWFSLNRRFSNRPGRKL